MPPIAIVLVLVAAVLHVGWNAVLKTSGDPLRTAVRLQAFGAAILVPVAAVAWLLGGRPGVAAEVIILVIVSGALEAAYFTFLAAAYQRGDLSLVYPLARGSAPLLAIVVGITILGERLAPVAWLGVACLLAGIVAVARPWRVLREAGAQDRPAVAFALATGVSIAAYSAVDRVAVRMVEPWLYGALLALVTVAMLAASVAAWDRFGPRATSAHGSAAIDVARARAGSGSASARTLRRDVLAGLMALGAYLLVLVAYSIAPLAAVAPLRESSVVLAAVWGVVALHEAADRRDAAFRIGAGGLVLLGAVLLAAGR